jgi:hypothetical protein
VARRTQAGIAHWVPGAPPGQPVAQINDRFVGEPGLIWPTGRIGGGACGLAAAPVLDLMGEARL